MALLNWNIEQLTGYKPKTTFYMDFSIADAGGESAVNDTYNRAFGEWKGNYEYLTELVMVLNWKILEHKSTGNSKLEELYYKLWEEADEYATDNLKGDELSYYYRTTD